MLENLNRDDVRKWFADRRELHPPFIYSSVDVRNAGFKTTAVDTNIFPAGWNLLSDDARNLAVQQAKEFFKHNCSEAKTIGLLAENFSRNEFYWANIKALKSIFEEAGKEVLVGVTEEGIEQAYLVSKKDDKLYFNCDAPCMIVSNRDFSSGSPEELKNISQPVFPPVKMGWYRRKKSQHFAAYEKIAKEFAQDFNIDPWHISAYFTDCGNVNFAEKTGLDCVANNVEKTLFKIRKKYDEYNIKQEPYVFVKADSGTFGMGIMTARSGEEIYEINKKIRNKMSHIKEGVENTNLIIQEGVPSIDVSDNHPAEPVIYFMNGKSIGCFMRYNETKDNLSNLNSHGMKFGNCEGEIADKPCSASWVGIAANIAVLAAIHERESL